MDHDPPCLDLSRLEKTKTGPGSKITARCPACAEEGRDRTGNHLAIFPSGKFTCVANQEHRRRIWQLVGIRDENRSPERVPRRAGDDERRSREQEGRKLEALARERRNALVSRYQWTLAELSEESPQRPDDLADDPRAFLGSLFSPCDLVWTGRIHESGEAHHARWRTVEDWLTAPLAEVGPMTTPATWKPNAVSRCRGSIARAPFVVLDFDGPDGRKPEGTGELARHLADSLALVRWLRERVRWTLAAVLTTGGKSVHAWFEHPGSICLDSLRPILVPFGIDKGLIGHPEHPCRLPGQRHHATGKRSRILWLR